MTFNLKFSEIRRPFLNAGHIQEPSDLWTSESDRQPAACLSDSDIWVPVSPTDSEIVKTIVSRTELQIQKKLDLAALLGDSV